MRSPDCRLCRSGGRNADRGSGRRAGSVWRPRGAGEGASAGSPRWESPAMAPREKPPGSQPIFLVGVDRGEIRTGAQSRAGHRMKVLIYTEYFFPIPGGVQTIVLE